MKRSSICCILENSTSAASLKRRLIESGVDESRIVVIQANGTIPASEARHFLSSIGIPEFEAGCYESKISEGGILFCVCDQSDERLPVIEQMFESTEARDVSITIEAEIIE